MPLTTGAVRMTATGITVECGTREIYDRVKAEEAARGIYTLTGENTTTLVLTFSVDYETSISTGALP